MCSNYLLETLADALLVSDEIRPLFLKLLGQELPAPLVGEDVVGDEGAVLGSPELSWPEHRLAILLSEQLAGRKALEAADWQCFGFPMDDDSFATLCDLLAREA